MRSVTLALAAMLAAGAAHAASIETYSKLPSMRMVQISSDGAKVAFIQMIKGQEAVVIDQLNPGAVIANIPPSDQVYDALVWVDATHLLVFGERRSIGAVQAVSTAQVVDIEKRKITALVDKTELRRVEGGPMVRVRGGRATVFVGGYSGVDGGVAATFEAVDFETGKEQRQARVHSQQSAEWNIDADGNLLSQAIYDQISHVWTLQLHRGADWVDVYSETALYDPPRVVGLAADGKNLVLERITEDHGLEFRKLSLGDGKLGDLEPEYVGLTRLIYDPLTHLPIGGVKQGMEPEYAFFDPKDQAQWDEILKVIPDEEVELASWSRDRSKAVVLATGLRHGVSYQMVDLATHKAIGIGPEFAGITPDDLADVQIVTYPAKDGLPIQALLTLPIGREPKNLPLVVLPHDELNQRDEVGYSERAQALASRGYAVLQPQFRGTTGLGWKLESAAFGEMGRKMQTDLSDGVRALASQGYIDPQRVCIVGGSGYGGYAAMAGVMFEQGVYRCAVALEPWTDLRKLGGGDRADTQHSIAVRNWERYVGAKDPNDPIFDRLSPSRHVADASVPILILHDRNRGDDVLNLYNGLRHAGKAAELESLSTPGREAIDATRLQILQAIVTFVEKNNPPK